jgi:hypothetical protein
LMSHERKGRQCGIMCVIIKETDGNIRCKWRAMGMVVLCPLIKERWFEFFSPRHVVLPIFVPHCPVQGFLPSFFYHLQPACSFGWWLIAGADLFWEKSCPGQPWGS